MREEELLSRCRGTVVYRYDATLDLVRVTSAFFPIYLLALRGPEGGRVCKLWNTGDSRELSSCPKPYGDCWRRREKKKKKIRIDGKPSPVQEV